MAGFTEQSLKPRGHQQLTTTLSAAVALTIPAAATNSLTARLALIQCETTSVRWRDDGTDPTTSVGMLLSPGETLWYNGDLQAIKLIRTAASAVVNVAYYS